ncbi:MAG TPA: methyltransferase [Mycobacterium sp.]|nr:methyltransferase [Mycobacterium sp.]
MVDRIRTRGSVRNAVVWGSVQAALVNAADDVGRHQLQILDAGGGTGGFAVPLAELGHHVTVVDASPDSLAALELRAAEAKVGHLVHARQGDAAALLDTVSADAFDVAICHSVLEVVDDPLAVLTAVRASLRAGGLISVVVANTVATVLHKAVAGRLDEALYALRDRQGRSGPRDPLPRRFSLPDLQGLLAAAGFVLETVEGVRVFADVVPAGLIDADPRAVETLIVLEVEAARVPALREVAAQLHALARRA